MDVFIAIGTVLLHLLTVTVSKCASKCIWRLNFSISWFWSKTIIKSNRSKEGYAWGRCTRIWRGYKILERCPGATMERNVGTMGRSVGGIWTGWTLEYRKKLKNIAKNCLRTKNTVFILRYSIKQGSKDQNQLGGPRFPGIKLAAFPLWAWN